MITNETRSRLGTLRRAPSAYPESGAFAVFGGDTRASLRKQGARHRMPLGQLAFVITAPQTYTNDNVRPSAALHERSP